MATRTVYEVSVKVTKIEEEEKDQYGKVIKPAQITESGRVDLKDYSSDAILSRLDSIVPSL